MAYTPQYGPGTFDVVENRRRQIENDIQERQSKNEGIKEVDVNE